MTWPSAFNTPLLASRLLDMDSALRVKYGVVFCSGFGVLNLGRAPDGCFHEVSMAGEHRQTSLVIDPPAEGGPSVLGGRVPAFATRVLGFEECVREREHAPGFGGIVTGFQF